MYYFVLLKKKLGLFSRATYNKAKIMSSHQYQPFFSLNCGNPSLCLQINMPNHAFSLIQSK